MSLRPFPFQLGIGTDIVHVERIRKILRKASGDGAYVDRFLRRFMTPSERVSLQARYGRVENAADVQFDIMSMHLAGRWAAKEAVIKAVSWRRLSFHDIVILHPQSRGSLSAVISDKQVGADGLRHAGSASSTDHTQITDSVDDDRASISEGYSSQHVRSSPHVSKEESVLEDDISQEFIDDVGTALHESVDALQPGDLQGQTVKISISHDGDYATAVCLAAEEPKAGDVGGEAAARGLL